jgi:hypothetical protein
MMVMAIFSLVILSLGSGKANIAIETGHLRGFKFDPFELPILLKSRTARWLQLRVLRIQAADALDSVTHTEENGVIRLSFSPKYAGRFEGIGMTLEFSDPLRLFSRTLELSFDNPVVEVIPLSLAGPTSRISPRIASTGDSPAGSPGQGQEVYGIDSYRGSAQTKDILWKRVARSPSQDLFVRIRESNVPETIRVSVIQTVDRGPNRYPWVDLVCESIGIIGNHLLTMGLTLRLTFSSGGIQTENVSALNELVDSMMNFSGSRPEMDNVRRLAQDTDLVITGLKELENPEVAQLISRKPSLLILEDAEPGLLGTQSVIFSGRENVVPLILRVIEK